MNEKQTKYLKFFGTNYFLEKFTKNGFLCFYYE